MYPSLTNYNASTAVTIIAFSLAIIAPLLHIRPQPIQHRLLLFHVNIVSLVYPSVKVKTRTIGKDGYYLWINFVDHLPMSRLSGKYFNITSAIKGDSNRQ